jgi:CHAT domain-containing protein/Tfp pilus assembly protein PilF
MSNYSKALKCFQLSLEIAEKENAAESKSQSLTNLSLIYIDLGNYDRALECLLSVLNIDKDLKSEKYIYMDLNNLGIIFRNRGILSNNKKDFIESNLNLSFALLLARRNGDKKSEVKILNNIGENYYCLENYEEAIKNFIAALNIAVEIQDLEETSNISNNIGSTQLSMKNCQKASIYFKRSIELALKINSVKILWEAYYGLGQCYEKNGDLMAALDCYKISIEIIDKVRSQIFLDTFKAGFIRNKLKVYESLINVLYELKQRNGSKKYEKEIFIFVEKVKARAFLEGLAESKIDIRENLSQELRDEEDGISNQITSIFFEISRPGISVKEKKALEAKLSQAEDSYMRLISKMREENPETANLVSPELSRQELVQEILTDDKTALIEYFLGEKRSYMFLITKNTADFHPLPSRQEIEKSVKGYLKLICEPPQKEFLGRLGAMRLFDEFLLPLTDRKYRRIEKLVIVPDGILYYLPFETLMAGQKNRASKYLINQFQVSYAPSSSVLMYLLDKKAAPRSPSGLLAFGDPVYPDVKTPSPKGIAVENILVEFYLNQGFKFFPIPYTRDEIRAISKYFPKGKKDIFLGQDAREENIKKPPRNEYQVVHFACHGFLDENQPFRSALVLCQDQEREEDGFLQVRELYNLRLKANLVVLSACHSGRGKLEKGEGILGLTRMFFYSGSKSVLSTLWSVNDQSTARFMKIYYRYLAKGQKIGEALRFTKLDMIQSKFSHPYYWAGFILNGDYDSKIDFR